MWKLTVGFILAALLLNCGECWRRRRRRSPPPAVHGGWSGWTLSSGCSKTCGTGIQYRKRTCNNPAPRNGGRYCAGPATESFGCNPHACPTPPPLFSGSTKFQRVGCYSERSRVLKELVITERDPFSKAWNGRYIEWGNWNQYMVGLLNRCASKVRSKGYRVFAASNYGECWSERGVTNPLTRYPASWRGDQQCVRQSYLPCRDVDARCVGKDSTSAVYKILN